METEFITHEQALALKELGFDEPCLGYYTGDTMHFVLRPLMLRANELASYVVTAPLYQQAFRFFREKYKSNFIIGFGNDGGYYRIGNLFSKWYKTYEEAELECLKKLIEIVKNK